MKNSARLFLASLMLLSLTACTKMVVGKFDEAELHKTNGTSWGVPKVRPTTWGFTGIPRDCTDCAQNQSK